MWRHSNRLGPAGSNSSRKLRGCIISLYMKSKPLLCLFLPSLLAAQSYDLVIKGGHIIDPANQIDGISDIAISGNKIARLARDIDASEAKKTVDATGLYVTPGRNLWQKQQVRMIGHDRPGGQPISASRVLQSQWFLR
jgi:hypothetical protein